MLPATALDPIFLESRDTTARLTVRNASVLLSVGPGYVYEWCVLPTNVTQFSAVGAFIVVEGFAQTALAGQPQDPINMIRNALTGQFPQMFGTLVCLYLNWGGAGSTTMTMNVTMWYAGLLRAQFPANTDALLRSACSADPDSPHVLPGIAVAAVSPTSASMSDWLHWSAQGSAAANGGVAPNFNSVTDGTPPPPIPFPGAGPACHTGGGAPSLPSMLQGSATLLNSPDLWFAAPSCGTRPSTLTISERGMTWEVPGQSPASDRAVHMCVLAVKGLDDAFNLSAGGPLAWAAGGVEAEFGTQFDVSSFANCLWVVPQRLTNTAPSAWSTVTSTRSASPGAGGLIPPAASATPSATPPPLSTPVAWGRVILAVGANGMCPTEAYPFVAERCGASDNIDRWCGLIQMPATFPTGVGCALLEDFNFVLFANVSWNTPSPSPNSATSSAAATTEVSASRAAASSAAVGGTSAASLSASAGASPSSSQVANTSGGIVEGGAAAPPGVGEPPSSLSAGSWVGVTVGCAAAIAAVAVFVARSRRRDAHYVSSGGGGGRASAGRRGRADRADEWGSAPTTTTTRMILAPPLDYAASAALTPGGRRHGSSSRRDQQQQQQRLVQGLSESQHQLLQLQQQLQSQLPASATSGVSVTQQQQPLQGQLQPAGLASPASSVSTSVPSSTVPLVPLTSVTRRSGAVVDGGDDAGAAAVVNPIRRAPRHPLLTRAIRAFTGRSPPAVTTHTRAKAVRSNNVSNSNNNNNNGSGAWVVGEGDDSPAGVSVADRTSTDRTTVGVSVLDRTAQRHRGDEAIVAHHHAIVAVPGVVVPPSRRRGGGVTPSDDGGDLGGSSHRLQSAAMDAHPQNGSSSGEDTPHDGVVIVSAQQRPTLHEQRQPLAPSAVRSAGHLQQHQHHASAASRLPSAANLPLLPFAAAAALPATVSIAMAREADPTAFEGDPTGDAFGSAAVTNSVGHQQQQGPGAHLLVTVRSQSRGQAAAGREENGAAAAPVSLSTSDGREAGSLSTLSTGAIIIGGGGEEEERGAETDKGIVLLGADRAASAQAAMRRFG